MSLYWQNGGEVKQVASWCTNRDIKRLNDALTRLRLAMPSLIVRKPKKVTTSSGTNRRSPCVTQSGTLQTQPFIKLAGFRREGDMVILGDLP